MDKGKSLAPVGREKPSADGKALEKGGSASERSGKTSTKDFPSSVSRGSRPSLGVHPTESSISLKHAFLEERRLKEAGIDDWLEPHMMFGDTLVRRGYSRESVNLEMQRRAARYFGFADNSTDNTTKNTTNNTTTPEDNKGKGSGRE